MYCSKAGETQGHRHHHLCHHGAMREEIGGACTRSDRETPGIPGTGYCHLLLLRHHLQSSKCLLTVWEERECQQRQYHHQEHAAASMTTSSTTSTQPSGSLQEDRKIQEKPTGRKEERNMKKNSLRKPGTNLSERVT
jgi:hypothetical protein